MKNNLGKVKADSQRMPVTRSGMISFGAVKVDCLVLDQSSNGAGLVLSEEASLPHKFDLVIGGECVRRHCQMVWRIEQRIGVIFSRTGNFK